jgi:hypothetical protein
MRRRASAEASGAAFLLQRTMGLHFAARLFYDFAHRQLSGEESGG